MLGSRADHAAVDRGEAGPEGVLYSMARQVSCIWAALRSTGVNWTEWYFRRAPGTITGSE